MYRCDKLLITGYRYVQEVDSKGGATNLSIAKGSFNEISTGNTWEIHKNSKKCYFDRILKPIGQIE